jgi:hypothetical protein
VNALPSLIKKHFNFPRFNEHPSQKVWFNVETKLKCFLINEGNVFKRFSQFVKRKQTNMTARTVTFGDVAENGPGMQHIGTASGVGLTRAELEHAKAKFEEEGLVCDMIDLREEGWIGIVAEGSGDVPPVVLDDWDGLDSACLLVVRGAVGFLAGEGGLEAVSQEQEGLDPDRKAWMRGRVVNKLARWNLCYADVAQEADVANRKGTIVPFSELPALSRVRAALPNYFGKKGETLNAELNVYYDVKKCGIGFHGDAERNVTIGMRLGVEIPFEYQWFHESKPIGNRISVELHQGDMYAMGAKAVGTDWKRRKVPTLRHAAGAAKFLKIK